jgi:hypothetical protein
MPTNLRTNLLVPVWIVSAGMVGTQYPPSSVPVAVMFLLLTIIVIPCVALSVDLLVRRRFAAAGLHPANQATPRPLRRRDAQG